jgi:hypothetical protein
MELVIGLGTTIFSGAAAAAPAAAAGTAAAAGAGSSFLTAASLIGTAFTALSTIGTGFMASAEAKSDAKYAAFQATDEKIAGEFRAAELRKQLALTQQRNKVAFASGGVDLGSVSVKAAQDQVAKDAEAELGMSNSNALRASLAKRTEARRLRSRASNALLTAGLSAGGTAITGAMDAYERG